ncbi:hypothetical protein D3C78_1665650 [compost metagenome]
MVLSRAKSLLFQIKKAQSDLNELQDGNKAKPPVESDYINLLSTLSKYQGYRIDPSVTTVAEFVAILKQFNQYVEHNNKKK